MDDLIFDLLFAFTNRLNPLKQVKSFGRDWRTGRQPRRLRLNPLKQVKSFGPYKVFYKNDDFEK